MSLFFFFFFFFFLAVGLKNFRSFSRIVVGDTRQFQFNVALKDLQRIVYLLIYSFYISYRTSFETLAISFSIERL